MLSLLDYMTMRGELTGQAFDPQPHNYLMCDMIERMIAGALPDGKRNLLINIPPRFGKTETAKAAIEWSMGHVPDSQYIIASYAVDRARDSSLEIRSIVTQPWYRDCFPAVEITSGRDRMDQWVTTHSGQVRAAGVGGPVLGFGAGNKREGFGGFFLIDDPIKTDEARASETIRKRNVDWYSGTAMNRLNDSRTPFLMIMQRTHPDDLSGWVLKNEPENWHHVSVRGHDVENDCSAWEQTASIDYLRKLKEIDPFAYYALYQQTPVMPGGALLREEWWQFYADAKEVRKRCDYIFQTADTAMKEKDANDFSVIATWGVERGGQRLYLLDQVRGKWLFPDLVNMAKAQWEKWSPQILFVEDKVSGTSLVQVLRQVKQINVKPWSPKQFGLDADDKVSRVKSASWTIASGKVWLPDPEIAPWVVSFLDECAVFTEDMGHAHDDQVDAMSMAVLSWRVAG